MELLDSGVNKKSFKGVDVYDYTNEDTCPDNSEYRLIK